MDAVKYLKDALNLDKFKRLYYWQDGKKKALAVNAFEEQDITISTTITDNPVEFGVNLNDTSFRNPIIIKAIVLVSDSQSLAEAIDGIGKVVFNIFDDSSLNKFKTQDLQNLKQQGIKLIDSSSSGLLKSSKIYNQLITLNQNFLTCELITRDRIYSNLQLININRQAIADNDGGCAVEITLKEVMVFGDANLSNIKGKNPVQNGWTANKDIEELI